MNKDLMERRIFLKKMLATGGLFIATGGSCLFTACSDGNSIDNPDENANKDETSTTSPVIPDKEGMTIKGKVMCGNIGIADVVVSDGYEVTTTNENGIYYLPSSKQTGFVFISIPGNYEVETNNGSPQFFQRLSGGSKTEQKDFYLTATNNTRHILLTLADIHLANKNNDLMQFRQGLLKDINSYITECQSEGIKVYGLTLGDQSWDQFWYDNSFGIKECMNELKNINCPLFNCMGNHDNDPYCNEDWKASAVYRKTIGPTYYSFNLGNAHYIVLDDIEYLNDGGTQGDMGQRNYNGVIVNEQIAWLKKDLATLKNKNTPVIIALHIPVHSNPTKLENDTPSTNISLKNGKEFMNCLNGFANVHIISGHIHINYNVEVSESLFEHNIGAVSATWWWTGAEDYANNHICRDGSPGGYGVWEIEDRDVKWFYKSIGYEKEYQFRTYDLNSVLITADKYAPNSTDIQLADYAEKYAIPNSNNEVLINIWNYDSKWKVEVMEEGTPLAVRRIADKDPLHIISYEAKRLNNHAAPGDSAKSNQTTHLFKASASKRDSTLEIRVTDRFGRVYTETMLRPKALTCDMR